MKKILHISSHAGAVKEWLAMAVRIGVNITHMFPEWGYNVDQKLADEIWEKHKDYFNSFDIILVSDTSAHTRILIRGGFKKPVITWVLIMIDYSDEASNNTEFPNDGYLDEVNGAPDNFKYIFWDECQLDYALNKGCRVGADITPSIGIGVDTLDTNVDQMRYGGRFYIPDYSNETEYMNLKGVCDTLQIPVVNDRFYSSIELQYSNGIICIPYTVRTLSLMENIRLGIPYFIPSREFLFKLVTTEKCWFQGGLPALKYSSWHNMDVPGKGINYFNSWNELKEMTSALVTQKEKDVSIKWAIAYANNIVKKWKQLFDGL